MSRSHSQISVLMTTALGLGSVLWIASGCGEIEAVKRWPSGAALLANTQSLDRMLDRVSRLE